MAERVFLGWDEPLLGLLVEWLWDRRGEMPGMLLVVPTAQGGRRLREALAERGACLAPKVVTPGQLLRAEDAAPPSMEVLAWVEALEGVGDWREFSGVFPVAPGTDEGAGWALALGKSLAGLERSLQENGLSMAAAAGVMAMSAEAGRWKDLRKLAALKQRLMKRWGGRERSAVVEEQVKRGVSGQVVLAGVSELPGAVAGMLRASTVTALIAAPEAEAGGFDELGLPLADAWKARFIEWPEKGRVVLCADPRQQAAEAVAITGEEGTASDDLVLGSADEETAGELERGFGRAGWLAYNPAGQEVSPVAAWWSTWRAFLTTPNAAAAIDLLGFSETGTLVGGKRAQRVRAISVARDRWLARDGEDVSRVAEMGGRDEDQLLLARDSLKSLETWRAGFLQRSFPDAVRGTVERIDAKGEMTAVLEWLDSMAVPLSMVKRDAGFWLELMLGDLGAGGIEPPDERVIDIQGWLELLHEPGAHLIVCGMNEGKVPASVGTDTWLPEGARRILGLVGDEARSARDAYLLTALLQARREGGRVDLLLAKFGAGGDALLPSRLLLAAPDEELAVRVAKLFRNLEPPDAGIAWQADWKWTPPKKEVKERMGVTALRDYLACPFRFYLKHMVGMSSGDPERVEWDARDFGNVIHLVLERWGLDEKAREYSKIEAIEAWVHAEFERVLVERFGDRPPLAVRIQSEGARQRLSWFARRQACLAAEGWHVEAVEEKIELTRQGMVLVAKVDRIDRHDDGRRRVLDYKTYSKLKPVEQDHRLNMNASTVMAAHLDGVKEVLCTGAKGKPMRWINLQVPLYSAALGQVDELGYFVIGTTEEAVDLCLWDGFCAADEASAVACADWILAQVAAGRFGPAAEKVIYDDYAALAMGRPLGELVKGWEA